MIEIDIENRSLELKVSSEELARRKANWIPVFKPRGPVRAKYSDHVTSADKGAILVVGEQRPLKCPVARRCSESCYCFFILYSIVDLYCAK